MSLQLGSKTAVRRRGDGSAVYARVAADIRQSVKISGLEPGEILPSLRQLAVEYKVSIATIQQAVATLVTEGVLTTKANRGLYVAQPGSKNVTPDLLMDQLVPTSQRPYTIFGDRESSRQNTVTSTRQLHIGIVSPIWEDTVSNMKDNQVYDLIRAMEGTLSETGASMEYGYIGKSRPVQPYKVAECTKRLIDDHSDAIALVYFGNPIDIQSSLQLAAAADIPVVLVNSSRLPTTVPQVYYDGRNAAAQAAQHLIKQGCRNLMFFSPFSAEWVSERFAGMRDALQLSGLSDSNLTVHISSEDPSRYPVGPNTHYELARQYATTLLQTGLEVDGIVADNDLAAFGLMDAADELGYKAGQDYMIVGFDDHSWSRARGLTSMRPPIEGLGQTAARLLIDAAHGRNSHQAISLVSHLVIRNSTRHKILSEVLQ